MQRVIRNIAWDEGRARGVFWRKRVSPDERI